MSGARVDLTWVPPGPVSAAFMASPAGDWVEAADGRRVRNGGAGLNGPVGSAKTTTALMKMVVLAQEQKVSTRATVRGPDGQPWPVRKFKVCVVRDTFRNLWRSTIPTWFKRFPREIGTFTGAENAPATHRITFALPDRTMVDFWVDFIAIGEAKAEEVLRGYEPTAFLLEELDMLAEDVFDYARTRTGRFPDGVEGGPTWHGLLFTYNAPEFGSWLYRRIHTADPALLRQMGIELFIQPGGLSPNAENLMNLSPRYYERMIVGLAEHTVQRMIHNKPGYDRSGKAIYPEFRDDLHVRAVEFVPGLPLVVGLDAGGSPAAAFAQRMPNGTWHVLDELMADQGTGATRFGQDLAQRLRERFPEARTIEGWADPSAAYGADRKAGERNWIEIVAHEAAIPILPAPSNAPLVRWEAVRKPLARLIDGQPGFLLNERCGVLREGFHAGYRYRRLNQHDDRFAEEADKNRFSHIHDALQYALLAGGESAELAGRREAAMAFMRSAPETDWNPIG